MLVKYIENNDIVVSTVIRCDVVHAVREDGTPDGYLLRFFTSDYGDIVICKSSYNNCMEVLNEMYDKEKVDISCNANFEIVVANVFNPEAMLISEDDLLDADDIDFDIFGIDPDDMTEY